jgi:hypothetical protein
MNPTQDVDFSGFVAYRAGRAAAKSKAKTVAAPADRLFAAFGAEAVELFADRRAGVERSSRPVGRLTGGQGLGNRQGTESYGKR